MNTRKKKTRKTPVIVQRAVKAETIVRRELERAELARDATHLKKAGLTYRQIAERLPCSPGMVHKLVHEGIDAYRAEAKQEIAEWIEGALVELRMAQDELWIQWERSKQDKRRRTVKTIAPKAVGKSGKTGSKKPKTIEATEMIEGQCADARYIKAIADCVEKCAKLLGICKGNTTNISVTQQAGVTIQNEAETKLRRQLATMFASTFPPAPTPKNSDKSP